MEVFPQKFPLSGLIIENINHSHPAQDSFLGDPAKILILICMVWHIIWPSFDFSQGAS